MTNNSHNSILLREHIEAFIAYKQASGYKAAHLVKILHRFIGFAEEWEPGITTVTKNVAEKWAMVSPDETTTNQSKRTGAVQELSKYLISCNIPSYLYPKQRHVASNFTPYIFSDNELARFFDTCDNTRSLYLVRSDVVPLIFRMIYSCGLRASEATNLTIRDVDLVQGTVLIRDTKFNKERLLPVNDSLLKRMKKYHNKVLTLAGIDSPFFPNG